jgi:hypothetical protein
MNHISRNISIEKNVQCGKEFLENSTIKIPSDHLKNKSSLLWGLCYSPIAWVAIGNTPTRFIF